MEKSHTPVSFGKDTDDILDNIERSESSNAYSLLDQLKKKSRSDSQLISFLSLASAKWVDHSGPFIGHGILNADPVIKASELIDPDLKDLALLQIVMYISDLLRHPNYGPFLLMDIEGLELETEERTGSEFSKALRSGNSKHMAEKLFAGLYGLSGKRITGRILYEALMQYGENEHRLLLPYHTIRLLDRENNWNNAVSLLRPSIQYLSTGPDISHGVKAEQMARLINFSTILSRKDSFDQEKAYDMTRMLLNSAMGNEMTVITEYAKDLSLPELHEAVALTSTLLLLNSDLEQHSVTGKHCILSMIRDGTLSIQLRTMALLTSMEGPRARRLKSYIQKSLDNYTGTKWLDDASDPEALLDILEKEALKGQPDRAFNIAGNYVRSGHDPDKLARCLLNICFTTEGPFESLHTSKMLVGMNDVTKASRSSMKWLHLASGAKFVSEMVKREKQESQKVMDQFRKYRELMVSEGA